MTFDYAALPRTPKGHLTAESKRTVAAHEAEENAKRRAKWERDGLLRAARADFIDISDTLDEMFPELTVEWITDRERRLIDLAEDKGRKEGFEAAKDDADSDLYGLLSDAIHRLSVLGLDTDRPTLDILRDIQTDLTKI